MSFTWIPFYEELADKLVAWRERQDELIGLLRELSSRGIPTVSLDDKGQRGPEPLTEIDPFTFFASFNRNITYDNRKETLRLVKERMAITTEVPADFDGIPVVDNMMSWFFPYKKDRKPDDIPCLWRLFAQAVRAGRVGVDGHLIERCLAIRSVGFPKLTMGLFWVHPRDFMPLDKQTRTHVAKYIGTEPAPSDWNGYQEVVGRVVSALGGDFPAMSLAAYTNKAGIPKARRYWAGGHLFGEGSQLQRFTDTRRWEIGWAKDSERKAARGAWTRVARIRPGDLFAIKGLGGRNNLRVHLVGKVEQVDIDRGWVSFQPIQQKLFRGKAPGKPGDGTWFETLVEVTSPEAIAAIFGSGTSQPTPGAPDIPRNLILYGPPGCGKTWSLLNEIRPAFEIGMTGRASSLPDVAGMTWFHVIALALNEMGPADVLTLRDHPLVRAKYAERAVATKLESILWGQLQAHTVESSGTVRYARRFGLLVFDRMEDGRWHLPNGLPEELSSLLPQEETQADSAREQENQFFVTFHPSFTYEDFVEGLRPESDEGEDGTVRYPVRSGVFKRACERAVELAGFSGGLDALCRLGRQERRRLLEDAPPIAVFVDEINRGNVARLLGELITLLEVDKRLGADNEVIVTLPASRTLFGVPSNLWIIGTMNTADRSIVALDTALRRRFSFRHCPPRPELLKGVTVDGVDLVRVLETINARLQRLKDPDHLIGHSYFWELKETPDKRTIAELRRVFGEAVLPLLREYFYDDMGRIGLVLGPAFVEPADTEEDVFAKGFEHDQREDLVDRRTWHLKDIDELDAAAFRAIYE